jgi:hypothetical protein
MDLLTLFGIFAVGLTLGCYILELRSTWWTLGFAIGCLLSSVYGFLQGAWPFGIVEFVWAITATWRWRQRVNGVRLAEPIA